MKRASGGLWIALLLVGVLAVPARSQSAAAPADTAGIGSAAAPAAPEVPAEVRGDSTAFVPLAPQGPWYRQPKWIMFRSVVIPGWGQWANGRHWKALVVAAGEGYLIYKAFDWGHLEGQYRDLARANQDNPAYEAAYLAEANHAASRRRDFTWWTIFAGVLSMGDAYVDAHLGKFDAEFRPQEGGAVGHEDARQFRLGLSLKLP